MDPTDLIDAKVTSDPGILAAAQKCGPGEDCSAFAQNLQKNRGIKVPRTAIQQYQASQRVGMNDLQPGDHVFFDNNERDSYNTAGKRAGNGYVNHVGVYLGNGNFIADPGNSSDTRNPQDLKAYLQKTGFKFMGGGRFGGGQSNPAGGGDPTDAIDAKFGNDPTDAIDAKFNGAPSVQEPPGGALWNQLGQAQHAPNTQVAAKDIGPIRGVHQAPQPTTVQSGLDWLTGQHPEQVAQGVQQVGQALSPQPLANPLGNNYQPPTAQQNAQFKAQADAQRAASLAGTLAATPQQRQAVTGMSDNQFLAGQEPTLPEAGGRIADAVNSPGFQKLITAPGDYLSNLMAEYGVGSNMSDNGAGLQHVVKTFTNNVTQLVNPAAIAQFGVNAIVHPLNTLEGLVNTVHATGLNPLDYIFNKASMGVDTDGKPITPEDRVNAIFMTYMLGHGAVEGLSKAQLLPKLADLRDSLTKEITAGGDGSATLKGAGLPTVEQIAQHFGVDPSQVRIGEDGRPIIRKMADSREVKGTIPEGNKSPVVDNTRTHDQVGSWVIRDKNTHEVVMETFNPDVVAKLNTGKYEAVPIGDYLGDMNTPEKRAAIAEQYGNKVAGIEGAPEPVRKLPAKPIEAPPVDVPKPPVSTDGISQLEEGLPGIRNLPEEMKIEAMKRAGINSVEKQAPMTVPEYASMLENMGIGSDEAASMARKGNLSPMQGSYLLHLYDTVDTAAKDASKAVDELKLSGASDEDIQAAQAKADMLDSQATDILRGGSHSTSEAARALRMTQELTDGTLDLSRMVNTIERKGNVKLKDGDVTKLRQLYSRLSEAQANDAKNAVRLTTPDVPTVEGGFGTANQLFTAEKLAAAKEGLKKATAQLSAGLNPDILKHLVTIGGYYLEGGLREFGAWAKQMRKDNPSISNENLRDVYNKSWQELKRTQMKGSEYGPDIQTKTGNFGAEKKQWVKRPDGAWEQVGTGEFKKQTVGIQSPEVEAARRALMAEIKKHITPHWGEVVGRYARASVLWHPAVATHIAGSGLATQIAGELSRLPTSIRNLISTTLLGRDPSSIVRQGFSARDFTAALLGGFVKGLKEVPGYLESGENSLQRKMNASPTDFFQSRTPLRDVMTKEGLLKGEVPELIGRTHGAIQQPFTAQPSIIRSIRESAYLVSKQTPESALQTLDPSLSNLKGGKLREAARQFLVKNPTDEMNMEALNQAAKNSMLHDNAFTQAVEKAKRSLRSSGSAGQVANLGITATMPVLRPGSNTVFAAAEHSPIGMGRSLGGYYQAAIGEGIKNLEPATRRQLVELMDKGLTGTALVTLGYLGAKNGWFTHSYDGGKDGKAYAQAKGNAGGVPGVMGIHGQGEPGSAQVDGSSFPLRYGGFMGKLLQIGADMAAKDGMTAKGLGKNALANLNPADVVFSGVDKATKTLTGKR